MRSIKANASRNYRLAVPAMWSFAVVQIGKRHVRLEQERT